MTAHSSDWPVSALSIRVARCDTNLFCKHKLKAGMSEKASIKIIFKEGTGMAGHWYPCHFGLLLHPEGAAEHPCLPRTGGSCGCEGRVCGQRRGDPKQAGSFPPLLSAWSRTFWKRWGQLEPPCVDTGRLSVWNTFSFYLSDGILWGGPLFLF